MKKKTGLYFVSCSSTNIPPVKTGSWRVVTPSFHERTSPCTDLCPCAESIPAWMDLVAKRAFEAAWRELTKENPFPLICGRVCYRFCEKECNRVGIDDRVSVNAVERFLGEYAVTHELSPTVSPDGRLRAVRIAVIGGGPAGLSAAHFLARAGCSVRVFDENKELGGVLRYGIPEYRMPKELLRREIANMVTGLGVETSFSVRIDKHLFERMHMEYDYVVVALGAHKEKTLFGGSARKGAFATRDGLHFLSSISSGTLVRLSEYVKHVCVIGGGNTAIDASRSALRLGASKVTIVYRRTETEMPAHKDEIEAARREGVEFVFLTSPRSVVINNNGQWVIECVNTTLGEADESGRRAAQEVVGSSFTMECDLVVSAVGEEADISEVVPDVYHAQICRDDYDGKVVYVGDVLYGPRSVSEAIASGKSAAQGIIDKVTGLSCKVPSKEVVRESEIKFHYLNARRKDPSIRNEKKLSRREFADFAETTKTISQKMAVTEASRCINCGTCIACDRCLNFCPDYAITKRVDGKYSIDLDHCKGCGLCADVCERSAIRYGKDGSDE